MATQAIAAPDSLAIANRLRPVLLHLNRHLRREVHLLGVSGGQISLLSAIQDRPGIGVADLAAREGTAASSISVHLDRLEASGLVTRQREAEGDRRRVGLTVTAGGERVLRAVRRRRTAWLASRLDGLDAKQRASVSGAIDALAALVAQS
jgi:DNA-binding MarR family transcriptional regulator